MPTKKEKQDASVFFSTKVPKAITSSMSKDEALTQQMINQYHGKHSNYYKKDNK